MKIVFWASNKPRELMLAEALKHGAKVHGDKLEIRNPGDYGETPDGDDLKYPGPTPDTDVAVVFGVKGKSRWIMDDHREVGKAVLYMDKGYTRTRGEGRHTLYSRISVNDSSPVGYMMKTERKPDRFERLGINPAPRRVRPGGTVLLCVSSGKYQTFHKLPVPEEFSAGIVRRLVKLTDRHIIYRPKPSAHAVKPVAGTSLSNGASGIQDALKSCHVLVTHGSAAAMDAVLSGVPAIVLGGSVARPVAETVLENVEDPFFPEREDLIQWCYAMAYCQWTTAELRSGEAWADLKREILRQQDKKE